MAKALGVIGGIFALTVGYLIPVGTSVADAAPAPVPASSIEVTAGSVHLVGDGPTYTSAQVPVTYSCPTGVTPLVDGSISTTTPTSDNLSFTGGALGETSLPSLPTCTGALQQYTVYMTGNATYPTVGAGPGPETAVVYLNLYSPSLTGGPTFPALATDTEIDSLDATPVPAGPVTDLAATATATTATVTWSPPETAATDPILSYTVVCAPASTAAQPSSSDCATTQSLGADAAAATFTGLLPGSLYVLVVTAVAGGGVSPPTPITVSTLVETPGTVATATVTPGVGTITLRWTPPPSTGGSPITGYLVRRSGTDVNGHGPYTAEVSPTARAFVFELLRPLTTYSVSVAAVNAAGPGLASAFPATTPAAPKPVAQHVSIKPDHRTITVGQAVSFSGVVTPHHRGTVILEQRRNGRWYWADSAVESATGRYTMTLKPDYGTYLARVVAVSSTGYNTGISATVAVVINHKPAAAK